MGSFYGALIEASPDELRDNEAFTFHAVRTNPGCRWVAIDQYYIEDEIPDELAALSKALGKRVIGFTGSNTALWTFIKVFRDGDCVRTLELSDGDGWRVEGTEQDFEARFFEVCESSMEYPEDEDLAGVRAYETRKLQNGARIPMVTDEYFSRALQLGGLVWSGGDKVVIRERKGFFARLFGG